MRKQTVCRLLGGVALILTLFFGVALSNGATAANAGPVHSTTACGGTPMPPCW